MIVTEFINDKLRKTYSDTGFMLRKLGTNEMYTEAVDLVTSSATYEETDIQIPEEIKENTQ